MALDPNVDPELLQEAEALKQREGIARMLAQRGAEPVRITDGSRMSWTQGAAQMMNAYSGRKMLEANEAKRRAMVEDYHQRMAAGIAPYLAKRDGVPAQPGGDYEDSMGIGRSSPGVPAVPGNPQAAITEALISRNPMLRQLGSLDYQAQRAKDLAQLQHQLGLQRDQAKPQVLAPDAALVRPGEPTITNVRPPQKAIPENWTQFLPPGAKREQGDANGVFRMMGPDRQWDVYTIEFERGQPIGYKKLDNAPRAPVVKVDQAAPVTVTELEDPFKPGSTIKVDARTFNIEKYLKGDKTGYLGPGPKLTDRGKVDDKTTRTMQGLSTDLQAAEDLLSGIKRDRDGNPVRGNLPTGSGLGTLVDKAAGFVGISPRGADEASELNVVSARLIGRVPRFEGPQSDRDTALYKQAAGDAGDSNKPRSVRLAAIRRMRELYSGYETGRLGRLAGDGATPPPQSPAGGSSASGVVNFADLP